MQSPVDNLVLLHPRFAAKRLGNNGRFVVVAVMGEVLDGDVGIGNTRPDQPFDLHRRHRHRASPTFKFHQAQQSSAADYQVAAP
jgi:hypothetical protein